MNIMSKGLSSQPTGKERSMYGYASLPNNVQMDKYEIVMQIIIMQLHKPSVITVAAEAILLFLKRILGPAPPISQTIEQPASMDTHSTMSIYDSLPEFPDMPIIAGELASEIASKVVNEVDPHNTTLCVLNILQKFSWESKVAITVATFVLTFGDSGLNMTAESKVNVHKSPLFNEVEFRATSNLIKALVETTSCMVPFENLNATFFTPQEPNIKNASIDYLVDVYVTIRAVVVAATHNITMSSRRIGYETASLKSKELFEWAENLKCISASLRNVMPDLKLDRPSFVSKSEEDQHEIRMWRYMPGVLVENIEVEVIDYLLVIKAQRELNLFGNKRYMPYQANIIIPSNGWIEEITASFKNDVLFINVPKITKFEHRIYHIPVRSV